MPTYFHDNFPQAQSWIFNVIPWMLMIPGVIIAGWFSNRLIHKGFTVGQTRKICESMCGCTEAFCLICIGNNSLKEAIANHTYTEKKPRNFRTFKKFIISNGFIFDDIVPFFCGFS